MAHLEKYTRVQLPHLLKHDERARDENGEYIRFGNKSIDTSRTHLNYNLHERKDGLSDYDFIVQQGKKYLAKNVVNRKDVNWVGSWIVTLPTMLVEADPRVQRRFFEETTRFIENRYGYDNIVGAYVHNDETTPHMHIKVLPIFYDEKKGKKRMSAKDVFNPDELRGFHKELEAHMAKVFGRDVGILKNQVNKDSKASKRTIAELKQETEALNRQAEQIKADNEVLNGINKSLEKQVLASKYELDNVKEELADSQKMNELLKEEMASRDFLGRKKSVHDEISIKMEMEISRRANRRYDMMSQELNVRSSNLKRKEEELLRRERAVAKENEKYNDYQKLNDRVERLENRNRKLRKMIRSFGRAVFRLSQTVFQEALSALKDFAQDDLLEIAGIKRKEHNHKKEHDMDVLDR